MSADRDRIKEIGLLLQENSHWQEQLALGEQICLKKLREIREHQEQIIREGKMLIKERKYLLDKQAEEQL